MVLYFDVENENGIQHYSVFCDFDWLENYVEKSGLGDIGDFLKNYTSKEVLEIMNALDLDNQPYTIQDEYSFFGSFD